MPDRFSVPLFSGGRNPDRGKYDADERLARIRLLLDGIEAACDELECYLGPVQWMHWRVGDAVIDCREELGLTVDGGEGAQSG